MYRFPWYLTLVSTNHASSNLGQKDMIKCSLQTKIEFEITMLPIYNFEFSIKCEDLYYMKN